MNTTTETPIDEAKLEQFMGSVVGDLGATLNTALIRIGDELGLYKAMAGAGPLTPAELAERTETAERYVREWLAAQAAGGYVAYDAASGRYSCRPSRRWRSPTRTARRSCSAASSSPAPCSPTSRSSPRRSGPARASAGTSTTTGCSAAPSASSGRATAPTWWRRGSRRSTGSRRSSNAGAKVADVGCGHGASTIIMAEAYPEVDVRRLRLPRGVDRGRAPAAPSGRGGRPGELRGRRREGLPRRRLRPGLLLRLPARHGRPGRGPAPRARDAVAPTAP